MFIEVHFLQSFAPSNLNRDDTGNPKDTIFGGVRRARISSQSIKRAIRLEPVFAETTKVHPGVRTRWMTRRLTEKLTTAGKSVEEASIVAQAFASTLFGKMDRNSPDRSSVLIYLSDKEYDQMAQSLLNRWDEALAAARTIEAQDGAKAKGGSKAKRDIDEREKIALELFDNLVKDWLKVVRNRTSAPDIALFGRMLAEKPDLNLEAACQVAHAISTHRVEMEFDFFTAVDDLLTDEEVGAGMMGVTPYNSATYYRYARIKWEQLVRNLDNDVDLARRTVEGFLRAALQAVPSGKQNAFAAYNPPDFGLAVVREDGNAWSLVNAFETPVRPDSEGGYMRPSIRALDAYWGRLMQVYGRRVGQNGQVEPNGEAGLSPFAFCVPDGCDGLLQHLQGALQPDVEAWIQAVINQLPKVST
ncbi:MAG: type I-E CRISPR-associated protein Cas7/Cse4/CasC [Clostridiales bacterium]|nr:type I-E CRISPR-associated protein Cas7/Cse4/CasC [Clostridiales bacterium]